MKIKFEPRDIWIGLYWTRTYERVREDNGDYIQFYITFYICLIPLFPIIFSIKNGRTFTEQYRK